MEKRFACAGGGLCSDEDCLARSHEKAPPKVPHVVGCRCPRCCADHPTNPHVVGCQCAVCAGARCPLYAVIVHGGPAYRTSNEADTARIGTILRMAKYTVTEVTRFIDPADSSANYYTRSPSGAVFGPFTVAEAMASVRAGNMPVRIA